MDPASSPLEAAKSRDIFRAVHCLPPPDPYGQEQDEPEQAARQTGRWPYIVQLQHGDRPHPAGSW